MKSGQTTLRVQGCDVFGENVGLIGGEDRRMIKNPQKRHDPPQIRQDFRWTRNQVCEESEDKL